MNLEDFMVFWGSCEPYLCSDLPCLFSFLVVLYQLISADRKAAAKQNIQENQVLTTKRKQSFT